MTTFATVAFQWRVLYDTHEELPFQRALVLRIGYTALHLLTRAIFMNHSPTSTWLRDTELPRAFGPSHILHPMVDAAGFQNHPSDGILLSIFNTCEVEYYLSRLGVLDTSQVILRVYHPVNK